MSPSIARALLLASLALCALSHAAGQPKAAVVLVEAKGLTPREVELVLQVATDEMRQSSGFLLDSTASMSVSSEATMLGCALEYECLLRAGEAVEVDAVVGLVAVPEGKKQVGFELLWVSSDARGLPSASKVLLARNPAALESGVRAGVKGGIPEYARKGLGALTVLTEAGSEVMVDGQSAGTAPMDAPLVLSAGVHRVDVQTPTRQRVTRSVEVLEAKKITVDMPAPSAAIQSLTAPPPPEPRGKVLRTASFVVGGVAVVSLAGGVWFGGQSMGLNGQVKGGECKQVPCPEGMTQLQAQQLSQESGGKAALGNAGVAAGLLLGTGAGVLYWLATREEGTQ